MIYMRGDRGDFERWHELGNAGWGWADVLPYFRKSENFVGGESPLHGTGGPLAVSTQCSPPILAHAFIAAAVECGRPENQDFNGP
jgi:choline dehydrogenase